MRKLTTEEWIIKAKLIHNDIYDYNKVIYVKSRDKVLISCKIHGEFLQEANAHLQGQGCPECRYINSAKNNTISQKEFIERCIIIHNNKYDYTNTIYINSKKKINVNCRIHGDFLISPYHHLNGSGCKICNGGSKYTNEEFIKKAIDIHGDKYDYSIVNYIDKDSSIKIICKIHGEFEQTPHNHISGCGCPKCKLKSQTKLYNLLQTSFEKEIIQFETKINWLDKQRFDIYFPKYNIAIEFNGIQHYESKDYFGGEIAFIKQQERDNLKRKKCIDNNCTLFELKYDYDENDYIIVVNEITNIINKEKLIQNEI